jgi:hypothetical protein
MAECRLYQTAHHGRFTAPIVLPKHANVSAFPATIRGNAASLYPQNKMFCLSSNQEAHVPHKTLIALAAATALGCLPMATTALAAHGHGGSGGHGGGGHVAGHGGGAHYARGGGRYYGGGYSSGPIYDSCAGYGYSYGYGPGYGYGGCPGYDVPLVGRVINGVLGGYGPY